MPWRIDIGGAWTSKRISLIHIQTNLRKVLRKLQCLLRGANLPKHSTIRWRREEVLWQLQEGKLFFVPGVLLLLVSAQFIGAALPGQQNPMALIESGTERALRILYESQGSRAPSLRQRNDEIRERIFQLRENGQKSAGPVPPNLDAPRGGSGRSPALPSYLSSGRVKITLAQKDADQIY